MVVIGLIALVFEILEESFPFGLFLISVLLSGAIPNHFLKRRKLIDEWELKPDAVSLTFGLAINMVVLRFLGFFSFEAVSSQYLNFTTWFYVAVVTVAVSFIIYRYNKFGNKWIKDQTTKAFLIILGLSFGWVVLINLSDLFDFNAFDTCKTLFCKAEFIIEKVLLFLLLLLFGYLAKKIFDSALKEKRYRR